jgi:hypothetical protein
MIRAHLLFRMLRSVAIPFRVNSPKACWPALGAVNLRGDPRLRLAAGDTTLRRVMYAAFCTNDGYLPADWVVRTTCQTPRCTRPDHLQLVRGGSGWRPVHARAVVAA